MGGLLRNNESFSFTKNVFVFVLGVFGMMAAAMFG